MWKAAATLSGTGAFISGAVTLLSGGILAPGNGATVGTLTLGSLVLNTGALSNFALSTPGVVGGTTNDLIITTGTLTLGGTLNITGLTGFGTGTYRLFNYGGALTNNALSIGTVPGGDTASGFSIQTSVANQVNLVVAATAFSQFWDGPNTVQTGTVSGGTGTWDNTTTNWTNATGNTNSAWNSGGFAVFEGTAGTVTLAAGVTMSGLQFVTTGYQITTANASTITAAAGTVLDALTRDHWHRWGTDRRGWGCDQNRSGNSDLDRRQYLHGRNDD